MLPLNENHTLQAFYTRFRTKSETSAKLTRFIRVSLLLHAIICLVAFFSEKGLYLPYSYPTFPLTLPLNSLSEGLRALFKFFFFFFSTTSLRSLLQTLLFFECFVYSLALFSGISEFLLFFVVSSLLAPFLFFWTPIVILTPQFEFLPMLVLARYILFFLLALFWEGKISIGTRFTLEKSKEDALRSEEELEAVFCLLADWKVSGGSNGNTVDKTYLVALLIFLLLVPETAFTVLYFAVCSFMHLFFWRGINLQLFFGERKAKFLFWTSIFIAILFLIAIMFNIIRFVKQ